MHIHIHAVILPWCFFACVSKVSFTISQDLFDCGNVSLTSPYEILCDVSDGQKVA